MTGSEAQVEWAERIKGQVRAEFDRVENALLGVCSRQAPADQDDTRAIVAILRRYRDEVLGNPSAGYFIHHWQEAGEQIRRTFAENPEYRVIRASRNERLAVATRRKTSPDTGQDV